VGMELVVNVGQVLAIDQVIDTGVKVLFICLLGIAVRADAMDD